MMNLPSPVNYICVSILALIAMCCCGACCFCFYKLKHCGER